LSILENRDYMANFLSEDYDGEPFDIRQTMDGDIYCVNYNIILKETEEVLELYSFLNSKEIYPLYFLDFSGDRRFVFDDDGTFSRDFINFVRGDWVE